MIFTTLAFLMLLCAGPAHAATVWARTYDGRFEFPIPQGFALEPAEGKLAEGVTLEFKGQRDASLLIMEAPATALDGVKFLSSYVEDVLKSLRRRCPYTPPAPVALANGWPAAQSAVNCPPQAGAAGTTISYLYFRAGGGVFTAAGWGPVPVSLLTAQIGRGRVVAKKK